MYLFHNLHSFPFALDVNELSFPLHKQNCYVKKGHKYIAQNGIPVAVFNTLKKP